MTVSLAELMSVAEVDALRPPPRVKPSVWIEDHVVLDAGTSAEPGRYRFARTPYLREIVDATAERDVEEVVCVKSVQVGGSTAIRALTGSWIDMDPGHAIIVYPTEEAAREDVSDRLLPMIRRSPALRRHLTTSPRDLRKGHLALDSMSIFAGWAGSPQSLATRACRRAVLDEVDKYPAFSGREASPVALAEARTITYGHRRTIVKLSTPTLRSGAIWRAYQACGDRREYVVPCPHCGEFQSLAFDQVKFDEPREGEAEETHASRLEVEGLAWYACRHCGAVIHEREKARMVAGGRWISDGQTVTPDGEISGPRPRAKAVGFRLNSLVSPWISWSRVAAEFLRAYRDPARLMNWRNSYMGEPFEQVDSSAKPSALAAKVHEATERKIKPGTVPDWASVVLAGVDVQKDHFYGVIRAWGYGCRSQLVWCGRVEGAGPGGFRRLLEVVFHSRWPIAGRPGEFTECRGLFIDSGYRTDEVYEFASRYPQHIFCVKGHGGRRAAAKPIKHTHVDHTPRGRADQTRVTLYVLDANFWKDTLMRRIGAEEGQDGEWLVHPEVPEDYLRHLTSEHRVLIREGSPEPRWTWRPVTTGAANHFLDCESYVCAGAKIFEVERLSPPTKRSASPQPVASSRDDWLPPTSDWIDNARGPW